MTVNIVLTSGSSHAVAAIHFFIYILFSHDFASHCFSTRCMFLWGHVVHYIPKETWGEHANSTQKGPLANPTFFRCGCRRRRVWDTPPAPTASLSGNRPSSCEARLCLYVMCYAAVSCKSKTHFLLY